MTKRHKLGLAFFVILGIFVLTGTALAAPSALEYEGTTIIWKIGETRVWRFPMTYAAEITMMSDSFNRLYEGGFNLTDLSVAKADGGWSLCVKDKAIILARPEHAVGIKLNPRAMALQWMSKIYEAAGEMHAQELTAEYKLKGGFDVASSVSWYGGKFIGRKFANGEKFTESHLTAAAKDLPFDTLVKITTPSTGKSVVVRITDRFRGHKNRVLDISNAAADLLGIKGIGVAKARIKVIGRVGLIGGK
jgi:rare lipoprotein A